MKAEKETLLKLEVKGDDINTLKSAIDKVVAEQQKVGFKAFPLSEDEGKIITKLSEALK